MEDPKNIFEILKKTSNKYPDRVFMNFKHKGNYIQFTFKETFSLALSLGNSLSSLINKEDKAAIFSENRPEWCISYLAISYLGGILVPLDTSIDEQKLLAFLKDSEAKIIFTSEKLKPTVLKLKGKIKNLGIVCFDDDGFDNYLRNKDNKLLERNPRSKDIASLIYTSGTTGKPKGIMLRNENFLYQLKAGSNRVNFTKDDVIILILPLYHIFAFTGIFLFSLYIGCSIVIVNSLKKNDIIGAIKEKQGTILFGVPLLFESIFNGIKSKIDEQTTGKKLLVKILNTANKTSISLFKKNLGEKMFSKIHTAMGNSLRLMVSGGAPIKKEILIGMHSLGFTIIEGYGLTETAPVISINNMENLKFGSVGRPLEGVEVKIDNKNREGVGEIMVRGPIVMSGYYKDEALTKKSIENGWLHTKDLGYLDDEGYLYIKGRKDDVIILPSGKNIYPDEIEQHYSKSNLIKEICIIGRKQSDNKRLFAYIVPDEDQVKVNGIKDIKEVLRKEIGDLSSNLPHYKRIYNFEVVEEGTLPKTSTLKFKKFEIKKNINPSSETKEERAEDKMDEENIIIGILKKISGKKDVKIESSLELDLHLDSLAIAEIISGIEEKLNVKIEYDLNARMNNVKDLIEFVDKKLGKEKISKIGGIEIDSGIPRRADFSSEAQEERLRWLSEKTGLSLDNIKGKQTKAEDLKGNVEHYVGMLQVPTGIAGPIKVNGEHANGEFYVPFSTTEGALVASVNRGMNIITKSGGANVHFLGEQLTKAPMFLFKNSEEVIRFHRWVDENFRKIKQAAETHTKHGKLENIDKYILGRRSILRLCFSCGDAMGANMITMGTQEACNFIKDNYKIQDYILQSNLEGEKKISYLNFLTGRGKKVIADIIISKNIVEKFLHTTPDKIFRIAMNSSLGSMLSGMVGSNAHIANNIAAIFLATGQDVAHVHDSSVGITTVDITQDGDLYVSVNLPSLAIGTVGGGTGLGTQKEFLEIMGCYGPGNVKKLAEIIAACVLAGEISLAGSQAAMDFAITHDKFGRNRPK